MSPNYTKLDFPTKRWLPLRKTTIWGEVLWGPLQFDIWLEDAIPNLAAPQLQIIQVNLSDAKNPTANFFCAMYGFWSESKKNTKKYVVQP